MSRHRLNGSAPPTVPPHPTTIIPPHLRRIAGAAAIVCAVTVLHLSVRYGGDDRPGTLDRLVGDALGPHAPSFSAATWLMVQTGDPVAAVLLTAFVAAVALGTGRTSFAVLAVGGMAVAAAAVFTLKPVVGRTLNGVLGFPSGHTTAVTTIALVTGLLVMSTAPRRPVLGAAVVALLTALTACAMGAALVVRGAHYATDAVGGFCLAVACVLGLSLLLDRVLAVGR
jgi:membrane-associated phospholipid phosphatase